VRIDIPRKARYNIRRKEARKLGNKNKRTNLKIIVPRFALPFVLELIAQDNPELAPKIKEILKAYM